MDADELYEEIKDKNVYELVKSVEYKLSILKPDGKFVHKLGNVRKPLYHLMEVYEENLAPIKESISEMKARDNNDYSNLELNLFDAIKYFKIIIS